MASIVFSFVGEQDPHSARTEEKGSIITLVRHLLQSGKQIKEVVLLYTEGTQKGALETKEWIASKPELQSVQTEVFAVSENLSNDPTDLLLAAQEVRKRLGNLLDCEDHIEFNASSGTPAMKSAFSILQAAGYVKNATVWQVRNPEKMKPNQERVFVTDVGVLRREFELQVLRSQVESYNYDSAYDLIRVSDIKDYFPQKELILSGLAGAKEWQRCKLDAFRNCIDGLLTVEQRGYFDRWYYPAYEEAYLGVVRHQQGNIVEAFFHTFRAFEGMLAFWGGIVFKQHILENNGAFYLQKSILDDRDTFFSNAKYRSSGKPDNTAAKTEVELREFFEKESEKGNTKGYLLSFSSLCKLFRSLRSNYEEECPRIKNLLSDKISSERNVLVHQMQGLQELDLYKAWGTKNFEEWQGRILEFLNFISEQSFNSWEEACLLPVLHQKILSAISEYQP